MPKSGLHQRRATRRLRTGPVVAISALVALGAVAGSVFVGGDLAPWASAVSCPVGTPVGSTSTCEVTFTTSGSFTMPSGVTAIEALVVGSGGKSLANTGYAGGGGEVKLATLATSGNLTITIGTSGATSPANNSSVVQAGGSTVTATGGANGTNSAGGTGGGSGATKGGDGGNGNSLTSSVRNGGSAIQVDTLAGSSSLFDGVTDWYGGGGAGSSYNVSTGCLFTCTTTWSAFYSGTPGTRAGSVSDTPPVNGYPVDDLPSDPTNTIPVPVMNAAAANSGGGAGATNWGGSGGSAIGDTLGASGIVIVRYVRTAPAPPAPPAAPVAVAQPDDNLYAMAEADPTPTPTPTRTAAPSASSDPLGPSTSIGLPTGPVQALPPGSLSLYDAGLPQPSAVTASAGRIPQSLVFVGQGWQLEVQSLFASGSPSPLLPGPALAFESAQAGSSSGPSAADGPSAAVSGTGLKAGSPVRFYLLPNTYLGQLTSDATGAYSGRISVPANLAPGQHTLQVNGFTTTGSVRSLNIGVVIRAAKPVRVRAVTTRVFFAPLSAELSATSKATLRRLVKRTGRQMIKTVALGYVQPTARIDNNDSLSMQRARTLARYLRTLGLRGSYVTLGRGVAAQRGASARRVTVKVTYRA